MLMIIVSVIHVNLFVLACMDLWRRRQALTIGAQHGFDMEHRKDVELESQRS